MIGPCDDCSENTDPFKLIREGADQVKRAHAVPDPDLVPVDQRGPEHAMVFASAYAKYLTYFDLGENADGDWQKFFASDVSAQLAVVAVEDVDVYRSTVKELLRALEDPELPASPMHMVAALGAVFDCIGTLARRLDEIKAQLPDEQTLCSTLGNLIRSQLSPMLRRLIGYYLAGARPELAVVDRHATPPAHIKILGRGLEPFESLLSGPGLTAGEWPEGVGIADWAGYVAVDLEEFEGAYGLSTSEVDRVNHLATHNLFTAACETFLAAHATVVETAKAAVRATFESNGHEPHYALFLAFLDLLEYARDEANTLTGRHLDFYYRKVLQLQERPAQPAHAHVLVELAKHVESHLLAGGSLIKAGKDDSGADAHFAVDRDLVANEAAVTDLKRVYRHPPTEPPARDRGRIFADEVENAGESWHPFAEKDYRVGTPTSISMPPADVGFAIASHYLWMAEGKRTINVRLAAANTWKRAYRKGGGRKGKEESERMPVKLLCRLTTEKGWLERDVDHLSVADDGGLSLELVIDGGDPPITPYARATHGYHFGTSMPILIVQVKHSAATPWDYAALEGTTVQGIVLEVKVDGLKTLALSNDHGPIDGSKPFLPFGSTPVPGSALLIGSKETFQKAPDSVTIRANEMVTPVSHNTAPVVGVDYLLEGTWTGAHVTRVVPGTSGGTTKYVLGELEQPLSDAPDLTPSVPYATTTRAGFVRLVLSDGYGTDTYPLALAKWISGKNGAPEPTPPVLPMFGSLSLGYTAQQAIDLGTPSEGGGRFFHLTPFGHAEQAASTRSRGVPLLPQFRTGSKPAEAELYIGVRELKPPQNLALLFQVDDGTSNPIVVKPEHHIAWTYLRGNQWVPFPTDGVADGTDGLLASGIVTLAVPEDATSEHTLLPSGLHWIRLAVATASDAVCRLLTVAAQALAATYELKAEGAPSSAPEFPPGTITKLDPADAAVKGLAQPFPAFGGRPLESSPAFASRVSERLRHKNRAISLWDYEHLVLEAFPAIYQARCLIHTQYEPSADGTGIYREIAPGHVTVVTIPDLAVPNPRDPLRPFTSLRVLSEIERFLSTRMSCFAQLHVRNPQFEEVRTELRVRFRNGVDEAFHVNRLKREIAEFLSPWAYRSGARPTFNGTVHRSVLVDFIEDRPYVNYVSDVHLFHRLPGVVVDGADLEEIVGSRAISILVSAPPAQHEVRPIRPGEAPTGHGRDCASVVD